MFEDVGENHPPVLKYQQCTEYRDGLRETVPTFIGPTVKDSFWGIVLNIRQTFFT